MRLLMLYLPSEAAVKASRGSSSSSAALSLMLSLLCEGTEWEECNNHGLYASNLWKLEPLTLSTVCSSHISQPLLYFTEQTAGQINKLLSWVSLITAVCKQIHNPFVPASLYPHLHPGLNLPKGFQTVTNCTYSPYILLHSFHWEKVKR